jgi:hypothetical protein
MAEAGTLHDAFIVGIIDESIMEQAACPRNARSRSNHE